MTPTPNRLRLLVGFVRLAYTKLEYAVEAFNNADDDDEIDDLKSIVLEAVQDGLKCKRNLLESLLGTVFLVDDLPKDVRVALQLKFKTPFPSLTPSSSPSTSTVQTTPSSAGKHERGPIVQDDGTDDYSDQDLETDVADHDIEMIKSNGTILETTDSIAFSFPDVQTVPDPAQRHERTRTDNKERTQDDFPDQVTEPSDGVEMVESNDAIQPVSVSAERPENRQINEDDDTQDDSASQDHEADDVDDVVEIIESHDAVRETTGYIRVGRQPIQSHNPAVRTAPFLEVRAIISDRLNRLHKSVDTKLGTLAQVKLDSNFRDMEQLLLGSFAAHPNETSSRLCDYTGLPLFWSPGPFSISVEAVYLYASSDGQLGYHTPTNVALIMSFLNCVKRTQPPLVLPLLGAWQRSLAHPDFQERRSLCAWVFNAMTNTAILHKLFSGTLSHQRQISLWCQWDYDKLREVLPPNQGFHVPLAPIVNWVSIGQQKPSQSVFCDLCNQWFPQVGAFIAHCRSGHQNLFDVIHPQQAQIDHEYWNKPRYACDYPGCNKRFQHGKSLSDHKLEHAGILDTCPGCGSVFSLRRLLRQHILRCCPRILGEI